MNSSDELKKRETEIPCGFPEGDGDVQLRDLISTHWISLISSSSPLSRLPEHPGPGMRLKYAPWLKKKDVDKPGVYIWLVPRSGIDAGLRFVHVGMSTRSMAERTREHGRDQFRRAELGEWCTRDRIYHLPLEQSEDGFGNLGKPLWDGTEYKAGRSTWPREADRFDAAKKFLQELRVVYLTQKDQWRIQL